MAISPFSLRPHESRSRLFWPTVCTIIATVVGGVLVYYLTRPNGGRDKSASTYTYRYGEVFEVNYPSSLEGVRLPVRKDDCVVCEIGARYLGLKWYEGWADILKPDVMYVIVAEKTAWRREMANSASAEGPWGNVKLLAVGSDTENKTIYLETKLSKWFFARLYCILRMEFRDGYCLCASVTVTKKTWKKSADQFRKSIKGIRWSPEAARQHFLKKIDSAEQK